MDSFKSLAIAIKQARLSKGLSQEAFAEILNVSATHVKHIESGHRKPSVEILFEICKRTDLSIDSILKNEQKNISEIDVKLETLIGLCSENEKLLIAKIVESIISMHQI